MASEVANAQVFDATDLRQPAALGAVWLVQGGDDPAYAEPAFDDSHWIPFNSNSSLKDAMRSDHPEVVWYRLHVKVAPDDKGMALEEWNIASAFEVYINGQRILANGQVAPFVPYTYGARLLKRIPAQEVAAGSVVIALRVHISRYEWGNTNPGFYATNLVLGEEAALRDHMWLIVIGQYLGDWVTVLLGIALGIVALTLFWAQRSQKEYLWIFLQFFAAGCVAPLTFYEYFHNVPASWDLMRQPLTIASAFFVVLMYFAFLRLRFGWWIRIIVAIAVAGEVLSFIGQKQGSLSSVATVLAMVPMLFLIAGVIPVLLMMHWRRGNREAGILLIPVTLQSLSYYAQIVFFSLSQFSAWAPAMMRTSNALFYYYAGPFQFTLFQMTELSYELSLAIILVLRSTRISRQQALLEGEVAAAREVQEVLLPEHIEVVPGFTVDSAYQPAQQVGGDFFQILPTSEGGMLVVVGDVAGKGLPAAMLVSVLVGAIRGVAEYTCDPAELLSNLNDRLLGRGGGGFSTALVGLIRADGRVSIANAGHLSPYLDGREVELFGALPLGARANAIYETSHFYLAPGSRLTFYSDGVVEAQNQKGELFGFERGRELSTQPAAAIVEAAKEFGQADDITVVAITREAAVANAA
jgi:phosphoserine phosphatase RsbU/P